MKLPKVVLVLALVYCAAVLIPLRRAQRLFATPSATLSLSNTPQSTMRRRTTPPRTVLRSESETRSTAHAASDATAPIPRRRLAHLAAERQTVEKHEHSVSTTERSAGAAAHSDCDRIAERDAIDLRPRALNLSAPAEHLLVTTQAVADLAAPPPKVA